MRFSSRCSQSVKDLDRAQLGSVGHGQECRTAFAFVRCMGYIWDVTWSWEARIALTILIGEAMSEWDHLEEQDDASTWFFSEAAIGNGSPGGPVGHRLGGCGPGACPSCYKGGPAKWQRK